MNTDEATEKLLEAAQIGNVADARAALAAGADVNSTDAFERTPLHWAAKNGHAKMIAFLVEHGANIDAKDELKYTPLRWATETGHFDVAQLLIEKGADVDAKDKRQIAPLDLARARGDTAFVQMLEEAAAKQKGGHAAQVEKGRRESGERHRLINITNATSHGGRHD